jgi:hypothetical protein
MNARPQEPRTKANKTPRTFIAHYFSLQRYAFFRIGLCAERMIQIIAFLFSENYFSAGDVLLPKLC